jgi:hypothetical protein
MNVPVARHLEVALLDERVETRTNRFPTVADSSPPPPRAGWAAQLCCIVEEGRERLAVAASELLIGLLGSG